MVDEDFECRPYLKELTLSEARTNFRFRSKMMDLAWNYKHDKTCEADLWKCERSQSCIVDRDNLAQVARINFYRLDLNSSLKNIYKNIFG